MLFGQDSISSRVILVLSKYQVACVNSIRQPSMECFQKSLPYFPFMQYSNNRLIGMPNLSFLTKALAIGHNLYLNKNQTEKHTIM